MISYWKQRADFLRQKRFLLLNNNGYVYLKENIVTLNKLKNNNVVEKPLSFVQIKNLLKGSL